MKYSRHALVTSAAAVLLGSVILIAGPSGKASKGLETTRPQPITPQSGLPAASDSISNIPNPRWGSADLRTRTYVVRVIDVVSKEPISHAKVWVEIGDLAEKRNGYTDEKGAFKFTWRVAPNRTRAHITVEAQGYMTVESFSILIEDRMIPLAKTK